MLYRVYVLGLIKDRVILMKYVIKTLKYLMYVLLTLLALIFIWVFIQTKIKPDEIPSIFGYKPFIVLSGSLETEIYKGDLVIVQ